MIFTSGFCSFRYLPVPVMVPPVSTALAFSSMKNYMYYANGSSVYRVNLSQTPLKEELQFTLPEENITLLKFNLYQKPENMQRS